MMNIPNISSVEYAVRLYYSRPWLCNKDIAELFGGICGATIAKLKKLANAASAEENHMLYNNRTVITEDAYKAWGLDIELLERRLNKLRKYEVKQ